MLIPNAVKQRIKKSVPKFRKTLIDAAKRDINESDTVNIVRDMLSEIFGWDRYVNITSEYKIKKIKNTYCNLAIKQSGEAEYLVEVKPINSQLKENHLRQAINYAANKGVSWVILTNGIIWQVYKVASKNNKAVSNKILDLNFYDANVSKNECLEIIFTLCKRGVAKGLLDKHSQYKELVNPLVVSAILQSDVCVNTVMREIRKLGNVKVDKKEILNMLEKDVIKRNLVESESKLKIYKQIQKKAKKNYSKRLATNKNNNDKDKVENYEKGSALNSVPIAQTATDPSPNENVD